MVALGRVWICNNVILNHIAYIVANFDFGVQLRMQHDGGGAGQYVSGRTNLSIGSLQGKLCMLIWGLGHDPQKTFEF